MSFELKVWKLHPQACRIIPAEKTLMGSANPDGLKWCGPYTNANKYGFWVYPPLDLDFIWKDKFECNMGQWNNDEVPFIKSMIKETDSAENKEFLNSFGGRVKVDFGRVEPNICQIWSGLAFQTPPGWSLLMRSPINLGMDLPYRIQEGILETDWLPYDIWINVAVQHKNVLISLRRDQQMPLAQLVPVKKEGYDQEWKVTEQMMNRDDEEGDKLYTDWADYNYKKYIKRRNEMEKDSGTYYKERARQKCPFSAAGLPKATPKRLFGLKNQ